MLKQLLIQQTSVAIPGSWVKMAITTPVRYQLPDIASVIESKFIANQWKRTTNEAVRQHWMERVNAEAMEKTSLIHLGPPQQNEITPCLGTLKWSENSEASYNQSKNDD